MENPLDTLGGAAKDGGNIAGEFLVGTARFLEQLTGNATAAAIFAGFLLFALSLIRVAATARNHALYGNSIRLVGIAGLIGILLFVSIHTVLQTGTPFQTNTEEALIYKGLTGQDYVPDNTPSIFVQRLLANAWNVKWYALIFVVMYVVGRITSSVSTAATTAAQRLTARRREAGEP